MRKKFMGVGCSHGDLADPDALEAVLKFKERFKPDFTFHLGDYIDMTAFRSKAKGTKDESRAIAPDFEAGMEFLSRLRPQLILNGNHEHRLYGFCGHHDAKIKELAVRLVRDIEAAARKLKAILIPYGWKKHYMLGNYKLIHGTIFSENATRDYAEMHGNCIHGHTHRAAMAKGRRDDNPTAFGVGTLTRVENMDYAHTRRSTLAWSQGVVWGYYDDKKAYPWLCERGQDEKEWVFPL